MWNLFITFVTQFIPAVWLAATNEIPQVTDWIGARAKEYWHMFLWLALIAIGGPLCLIGLAILSKAGWLIALIGLLLACILAILLFKPVYIGLTVLLGAVWNLLNLRIKGTADVGVKWAKVYINIVGGFLLWELLVIFLISIFPIWNNLAALPIIALCSVLLPLMISIWGIGGAIFRRIAYLFVLFVLIFEISSMVFPLTGKAVTDKRPKLDKKMAEWIENPTLPKTNFGQPSPKKMVAQHKEGHFVLVPFEKIETGMWFEKDDLIQYKQTGVCFWIKNTRKSDIEVTTKTLSKIGLARGMIVLINGPEQNEIETRVIPH